MSLYFFSPEECEKHEMGANHPESPARLKAIKDALIRDNLWDQLSHQTAKLALEEELALGHAPDYVRKVFDSSPDSGYQVLDPDTSMNAHSLHAARLATGAAIQSVDAIFAQLDNISKQPDNTSKEDSQGITQAFCSVRPPGHHAEYDRAMGFCLFNSIAVAAKYAKQNYGLNRIAIVDFDVHHGNGTEHIVANDETILLISSFQWPFYPNSGIPPLAPNIHNVPLDAFTDSDAIRNIWRENILPLLDEFQPELVLVSAGFDAHKDDPLAQLNFVEDDYAFFATHLKQVAQQHANGRLLACLEGGYNLNALGNSVAKFIGALI